MVINKRKRLVFAAIAVILVGILVVASACAGPELEPKTQTFNIVTYHWGYALYDEDWNEIEQIEVKRGTTVRLVAIPAYTLSHEIQEEFHERVLEKGFGEYPPGDPRIPDLVRVGFENPAYASHGVLILPFDVDLRPNEHASTLEAATDSVEFTTDALGNFGILCSVACGIGHPYMALDEAFVVR